MAGTLWSFLTQTWRRSFFLFLWIWNPYPPLESLISSTQVIHNLGTFQSLVQPKPPRWLPPKPKEPRNPTGDVQSNGRQWRAFRGCGWCDLVGKCFGLQYAEMVKFQPAFSIHLDQWGYGHLHAKFSFPKANRLEASSFLYVLCLHSGLSASLTKGQRWVKGVSWMLCQDMTGFF